LTVAHLRANDEHDGCTGELAPSLGDAWFGLALCCHHIGTYTAELQAGVTTDLGKHPRPRELVVGRPRGELAQLLHDAGINVTFAVDHQIGASGAHECGKVVEVHPNTGLQVSDISSCAGRR